ncbi:MAG TPA: hypothetical protein VKI19_04885 [Acidimicrobiales bacterium]|nr:hypothetical protein [Acidimicrobiales bacterium]
MDEIVPTTPDEFVSMSEIDAEAAVPLPNKEVLSLLDVNANVDLGLDLAAPVDLAAAANLNVAAPIEASASANVLSPLATAIGVADQHGSIDQTLSGSATATAPQHAGVTQASGGSPTSGGPTGTDTGGTGTGATGTGGTSTSGGVDSLLNGGSLLDANVNIHANLNLAAPIDGAVAANGNVAAPIDAGVAANILSPGSSAEALAPQDVQITQSLNDVSANATADQTATVAQSEAPTSSTTTP